MRTHLKPWLIGAAVAVAAAPVLVLLGLGLFSSPNAPVSRTQLSAAPAASFEPPAPAADHRADLVPDAPPPEQPPIDDFDLPPDHVFGGGAMLGPFRVRAINRYWAGPTTPVLTLEQALASGVCTISETGRRESVLVQVSGEASVLVLTGDLLIGGRQDRLVARSMILEPGTTIMPVYCAETLRWTPAERDYANTFRQGPQVDLNVKAAMYQMGTQSAVWHAIEQVTVALDANDPGGTGAYRNALAAPGADAIYEMVRSARKIVSAFTVGFAVFRDADLVSVDLFASTELLGRVSDQLLRGYAMTGVYGDVSNWAVAAPLPMPEPIPAPPQRETDPPSQPAPPPTPLGIIDEAGRRRFECRRTPESPPIHTGIFRK